MYPVNAPLLLIYVVKLQIIEGITKTTLARDEIVARLKELLSDATCSRPLILLVYNREKTLEALREYANIDSQGWATSLFPLF